MSTTETRISVRSDSTDSLSGLLESLWGFFPGVVISCSVKQGLFDRLEESDPNPLSLEEISKKLGWAPRGAQAVVRILEQIGLVATDGRHVALTDASRKWLGRNSTHSIRPYLPRLDLLRAAAPSLGYSLTSGKPVETMRAATLSAFGGEEKTTEEFALTMRAAALEFGWTLTPLLESLLDRTQRLRFLDVGCGPGTLSIILAEVFSSATFDAFDLSGVAPLAGRFVAASGYASRINVAVEDWRRREWPPDKYDVVLLSQVLHEEDPSEAGSLFRSAVYSLKRGALLVVVIVGDATIPGGDIIHRYFSMAALAETGGSNPDQEWLTVQSNQCGLRLIAFQAIGGGRSVWIGERT